jgi:Bacterial Ig-like domain (group 3)/FG-GAP-like repeat/FG-GAP repeat
MTTTRYSHPCVSIVAFLLLAAAVPCVSQIFKTPALYRSGGTHAQSVAVADVNGDGKPDVIVANQEGGNGGSVGVLLNNGDGTLAAAATYNVGSGADSVAVGDLNGDGFPDLVVASADGPCGSNCKNVSVLINNGDGTFRAAVFYPSGGYDVLSVAVADVNGDGNLDVVLANQCADRDCTYGLVSVMLGNGDGTFLPVVNYGLSGFIPASVTAADLRQNGRPDLLVANFDSGTGNGSVGVLLNNGDGTFQPEVNYASGGGPSSVVVGDVNGDGIPDAVVGDLYYGGEFIYGSVDILLGKGDGTFAAAVVYPVSDGAKAVALADFNGDGKLDIAVASGDKLASVGVLLNNGSGVFNSPPIKYSAGGLYAYSVVAADLNQDGKPDLIVADETDGYHTGSPFGGVAVLIGVPAKTKTTVSTSGSPSLVGSPVTFTATVTAAYGPVPNGVSVAFYNGSKTIGTATTMNGVAKFTTSSLPAGTHTIKASYPSSAFFKASSGTVTQVVNP